MRIAVFGCGFIASSYASALPHHPMKLQKNRSARGISIKWKLYAFVNRYGGRAHFSESDCLADERIQTIVNLTNPRVHYAVTRAALEAGKQCVPVPKASRMDGEEAKRLVATPRIAGGLMLATGLCSVLSETAETVRAALRAGVIRRKAETRVRKLRRRHDRAAPCPLELEERGGAPWPAKDEFEVRNRTYEHAGLS